MGARALVSLPDGSRLAGVIERFDPGLPDFTLRLEDGAVRRVRFAEVRAVSFLADEAAPLEIAEGYEQLVTLRYFDGDAVRGVLQRSEGPRRGVHLAPIGDRQVSHLYVPISAIRDVVAVQNLGQILVREGIITTSALDDALARQRELRERKLGEILLERGAVDPDQVRRALELQEGAPGKRIGDVMLDLGFVSAEQLGAAVEVQKMMRGKRLGELLIELGFADAKTITIALALQFRLPFVTLASLQLDPALRGSVPASFALAHRTLPLDLERGLLTVAVSDPTRLEFKGELRARTGMRIAEVLTTQDELDAALASFYA